MAWNDLLGFIVVIALVVIPALAFTARFALKPIVESMLRIREALDHGRTPAAADARLAALEEHVATLQELLERVVAAVEFDARLRAEAPRAAELPAAGGPTQEAHGR